MLTVLYFLMTTWALFLQTDFFVYFLSMNTKSEMKQMQSPAKREKKRITTKMFTWCNHRTEQMDVLRTMNFQANGTDNTIHTHKIHYNTRIAIRRKKNWKKAMNNNKKNCINKKKCVSVFCAQQKIRMCVHIWIGTTIMIIFGDCFFFLLCSRWAAQPPSLPLLRMKLFTCDGQWT